MKLREQGWSILVDVVLFVVILLCVVALPGCSATGGAITVQTAVPIACQEEEPERPFMPTDSLKKGANIEQFARASRAELLVRESYEDRLRTALSACIAPIATPALPAGGPGADYSLPKGRPLPRP